MKKLLIIDGYNVIFGALEFLNTKESDLEHSRERLITALLDYSVYNDLEVIVVFDGRKNKIKSEEQKVTKNLRVVFTAETETADSYIERITFLEKDSYRQIFVVTSDGCEQNQILGNGAYRVSVQEFVSELGMSKKEQAYYLEQEHLNLRNEIACEIKSDVFSKLEELRFSDKK